MIARSAHQQRTDVSGEGGVHDDYPVDGGRLKNALKIAPDKAGRGEEMSVGEAHGLTSHGWFVTYTAVCALVKIVDGQITVLEMHIAFDRGFAAMESIESQIQGAAVQGMTFAPTLCFAAGGHVAGYRGSPHVRGRRGQEKPGEKVFPSVGAGEDGARHCSSE